jgi:hypothetical protein
MYACTTSLVSRPAICNGVFLSLEKVYFLQKHLLKTDEAVKGVCVGQERSMRLCGGGVVEDEALPNGGPLSTTELLGS